MRERGTRPRAFHWLVSRFPLYPLVFAAVFPLQLYESNFDYFPISSVPRPLAVVVLTALALVLLLAGATRKFHQGGIGATLFIFLLLFYEGAALAVTNFVAQSISWIFLPVLASLAVLAAGAALAMLLWRNARATQVLNASAAAVLVYHLFVLVSVETRDPPSPGGDEAAGESGHFADAGAAGPSPNIFHIVLDGYTRADVLAETYGVDNSAFIDRLEGLGFAVADQAVTPYNQTLAAMNAVFFGRYLSDTPGRPGPGDKQYREFLSVELQGNPVTAALSRMGYTITANRPDYPPVGLRADFPFDGAVMDFTAFESILLERTLLRKAMETFGLRDVSGSTIRATFAIPFWRDVRSPFFAYVHVIAPHPPFDVDRNGNPLEVARHDLSDADRLHEKKPRLQLEYRNGYVEKLLFINTELYGYVRTIIRDAPNPKLIIVHGDHGGGLFMDHDNAGATCHRERFSPLLAVYSSDGALQHAVPEDMNLVNLYRIVFNTYFQTNMPLLASRSYFVEWLNPTRRTPITAELLARTCPTDFVPRGAETRTGE